MNLELSYDTFKSESPFLSNGILRDFFRIFHENERIVCQKCTRFLQGDTPLVKLESFLDVEGNIFQKNRSCRRPSFSPFSVGFG